MTPPLPTASQSNRTSENTLELYQRGNLTRRQLLMWIGQKMQPDAPDYGMANLYRIQGSLDPALFSRAVQRLVGEADALRTVVRERETDGAPRQEVLERQDAFVALYDLTGDPDADATLEREAHARASEALAIETCVFDFVLFLLPGDRSALYFNLHHIVGDGWALTLLYRRLSEIYRELELGDAWDGTPSALAPFSAYLPVERAYSESSAFAEDEAFWAENVTSKSEGLTLYGEPARGESGPAERASVDLGLERTGDLKKLAASEAFKGKNIHASLQNMFCAALCAWLHRIGPNDSVTVGLPFHNRADEFKATIGLFMQVLPVRVEIAKGETFRSLYAKVTAAAALALKHRRYTVENPLKKRACDVIMNYLTTEFGDFAGRPVEYEWVFARNTNVALSVQIHDFRRTGSLHFDMDMQSSAFPELQRKERGGAPDHLLRVLDALLAEPDRPIADIEILDADELERLFDVGRGPIIPVNLHLAPSAFEAHARRKPDAPAVICGSERVSYGELNGAANRIARRLRTFGVGRDARVAVFLDRSPAMVEAIIGVLKAGAGYVPVDPSYPPARVQWTLEDCMPRVILTRASLRHVLEPLTQTRLPPIILCIDDDPALADESPENISIQVDPDDLAYIIYTSGSTGRPKGVEIPRRAMANYLESMRRYGWLSSTDTILAISPLAFDFHVPQIHLPLIEGSCIVLATREEAADAKRLIALISANRVTAMAGTPTSFRMMLEAGWCGKSDISLHCGGEALTPDLVQKLRPRVAALWNVYGPTETTVYSTMQRVELGTEGISVGRPIANTQLYIVDAAGRYVPEGVTGELWIGGDGLARGYLNRPELTAEKFVIRPEGRLYRTGDLARFLPDGTLSVVGRIDHQVKIRGYRIELGEIEAELSLHPGIKQAAVVVREDPPGNRRLVAYIATSSAKEIPAADIRAFLAERLPSFMVPSMFIALEKLPLSPNGKVDRGALPAPTQGADERAAAQRSPNERPLDLLEYQLACIFEEVLGVSRIDPKESFFELGGSSLLAVRLLSRIEAILGKSVSVQALFSAPSVERLAATLKDSGFSPTLGSLVPLVPRGSWPPFFCVHAFIGDVCRGLARQFTFGQPFYGLQPRGLDGIEEPLASIEEMAAHYIKQIRRVSPRGPYHLGGYCFGGIVAFEMARQLKEAGEEVATLAIIDSAPRNVRPRRVEAKIKGGINEGLRALEKAAHILRADDPIGELRQTLKRLDMRIRTRASGALHAEPDLDGLREQMEGLDTWPLAYQRMARVHYAALLRYVPGFYDGRVTLIRTAERPQRWAVDDETWGFGEIAAEVEVHVVPGKHDEIMNEPHVRAVADVLEQSLMRARGPVREAAGDRLSDAAPRSTGPRSAGPLSTGPRSAGPRSAGPRSAGPRSAGPLSTGPRSAGPTSALA